MVSVNTRLLYNVYGLVKAIVLMKGDYKLVYHTIIYTVLLSVLYTTGVNLNLGRLHTHIMSDVCIDSSCHAMHMW